MRYFLEDSFEHITVYDLRAVEATAIATGGGGYRVVLSIDASKLRADDEGRETQVRMGDWIEIGVFEDDRMRRPLYLGKHRIDEAIKSIEISVDGEPRRAGIDPYHKLVDRDLGDNTVRVVSSAAGGPG